MTDSANGILPRLLLISAVLAALIFAVDLSLPMGIAGGVPYVALVLLGIWFPRRWHLFALAALGSVLIVLGFFLSPADSIPWVVLTNRGLALFAIWVTAFLLAYYKMALPVLQQVTWREIKDYHRPLALVLIMSVVATVVGGLAVGILYQTAFNQQRVRLIEIAQSQARLVGAIVHHEINEEEHEGNISSAIQDALGPIIAAHENYVSQSKTGEFTIAELKGDEISFLLHHNSKAAEGSNSVPLRSGLAEPMRRALAGQSGTLVGLDYRGETVLAAFEPMPTAKMGLVAKIDMAEIRAPFIMAGGVVTIGAVIAILVGALFFSQITNPMIEQISESGERFRDLYENAPVAYASFSAGDGDLLRTNAAFTEMLGYGEAELVQIKAFDLFADTPEGLPKAARLFKKLHSGSKIQGEELQMTRKDGALIWVNLRAVPVTGEDSNIRINRSTLIDITEKKLAEEKKPAQI